MEEIRKRLLAEHRRELAEMHDLVGAGPVADVEARASRIEAYGKLIIAADYHQKEKAPIGAGTMALAIGLICLAIVSGLITVRVGTTPISATIWTSSVSVRLTEAWSSSEPLRFEPGSTAVLSLFETLAGYEPAPSRSDTWISGGSVALHEMSFAAGTLIEWDVVGLDVLLRTSGSTAEGVVWGSGASLRRGRLEEEFGGVGGPGEMLTLRTLPESGHRGDLRFRRSNPLLLRGLILDSLAMLGEVIETSGGSRWRSAVLGGRVHLRNVRDSVSLPRGESLVLEDFAGRIVEMEIGDSIRIQLEGTVAAVRTGEGPYLEDHTPSWLEYLYRERTLGLVWGALVFVWSLLWGARRLLGRP